MKGQELYDLVAWFRSEYSPASVEIFSVVVFSYCEVLVFHDEITVSVS